MTILRGVAAVALGLVVFARATPIDPIDLVTEPIDTSVTPDIWLASYPDDAIGIRAPSVVWSAHHENCRVVVGNLRLGQIVARRIALFVVPPRPAGLAFDPDTARMAERRCELRSIRLDIAAPDEVVARHIADSLIEKIDARLGAAGRPLTQPDPGVVQPQFLVAWERPSMTTTVSVTADRAGPMNAIIGWAASAEGYTTAGDFAVSPVLLAPDVVRSPTAPATRWALLDSMLAEAAIRQTRGVAMAMERLTRDGDLPRNRTVTDSIVLPALRVLVSNSRQLPSARRAAALVAAHLLVAAVADQLTIQVPGSDRTLVQSKRRLRAYEAVGAKYESMPSDDEWIMGYTGNWRDDAYRIAPLSHAGRTAFLTTFGQTDAVAPGCRRNAVYNTLIEHDEPALRAHAADSVVLHRSLAEAYADVISMAMGRDTGTIFMQQINERYEGFPQSPSGQTDLDTLRAAVPRAQRLGFAHARAALELSHDPVDRAAMWHLMFRLAAGIPGQIRHFCMDAI